MRTLNCTSLLCYFDKRITDHFFSQYLYVRYKTKLKREKKEATIHRDLQVQIIDQVIQD